MIASAGPPVHTLEAETADASGSAFESDAPSAPQRRWQHHVAAVGAYVLVALVLSWPLAARLQTHLTGSPDSDTGVYVWNLWVFQYEVLEHRTLPYFTDRIFRATGRANLSLHNYTAFANIIALPLFDRSGSWRRSTLSTWR